MLARILERKLARNLEMKLARRLVGKLDRKLGRKRYSYIESLIAKWSDRKLATQTSKSKKSPNSITHMIFIY